MRTPRGYPRTPSPGGYNGTMLTSPGGRTITVRMPPAVASVTFGRASTSSSRACAEMSAATSTRSRTLSEPGPKLLGDVWSQRGDHEHERFDDRSGGLRQLGEDVVELRQPGNCRVESEAGVVTAHRVNRLVQGPHGRLIRRLLTDDERAGFLVNHVAPQALKETLRPDDSPRLPRFRLIERPHSHLIEAQGVRAVLLIHLVGADHVLERFADLAELAAHRLTAPGVGRFRAADTGVLDNLARLDVLATRVGERRGLDVALAEVGPERFVGAQVPQVVQHLVPEPGIEQVQDRVLDAADIEVDAARVARPNGSARDRIGLARGPIQ